MWARLAARFPAYYVARHDSDFRRHEGARSGAISNEGPERFVAMLDSLESTFRRELRGFDVSRSERARNRSLMLMDAARDAHLGGGWRASYRFYARSIREHPPTAFGATSLRMLAHGLLGRRLSRLAGRALRTMHT
jgi:hypothetical protein